MISAILPFVTVAFRLCAIGAGGVLLGAALFLYEDQEGQIQNRLEEWWIRLDDTSRTALSRHAVFMKQVAITCGLALDRLFGKELISPQSLAVSACCAIVSINVMLMWPFILKLPLIGKTFFLLLICLLPTLGKPLLTKITTIIGLLFFISSVVIWLSIPFGTEAVVVSRIVSIALHIHDLFTLDAQTYFEVLVSRAAVLVLPFNIGAYLVVVAIERRVLRWGSGLESIGKLLGMLFVNAGIVVLTFFGPLALSALLQIENWDFLLITFSFNNLATGIVVGLYFTLAMLMLLHRLIWPVVERPVYALARRKVIGNSKVLIAVALALLTLGGLGPAIHWVTKLADP